MRSDLLQADIGLADDNVRLRSLSREDAAGILVAAADPRIWQWMAIPGLADTDSALAWIEAALALRATGAEHPLVILDRDGAIIGSTRIMAIRPAHDGVEIGWTWLNPAVWRTAVNTSAKRLLLGFLFDAVGCERVEFKTDLLNTRSQAAIERLGAVREGVLRHHMRRHDGTWRDSVYFSILRAEWAHART